MGHRAFVRISVLTVGLALCNASAEQAAPEPGHLREVILETAEECRRIEGEAVRGLALSDLAMALAYTGELDDALDVARTDPAHCVAALRYVAFRLAAGGRLEEAARVEKLVEMPFWKSRMLVDLAAAYIEAGQNDKAVSCLERAEPLAKEAKDSEILARVGLLYAKAGKRDLAKRAFAGAFELKRKEFPACVRDQMQDTIYEVEAQAGFVDEAIQNAIAANEHYAVRDIAIWQAFSGDIDGAKATAQKCGVTLPIQALEAIACFEIMAGKRDEGLATLDEVLRLAATYPGDEALPGAEKAVAIILAQSGETAKALALVEKIKSREPTDTSSVEARTGVAVRIASADRDAALRLLSTALEEARALTPSGPGAWVTPPGQRVWVMHGIGLAYHQLGKDETAREVLLEAIERSQTDPGAEDRRLRVIAALARAGGRDAAEEQFDMALRRAGDDQTALSIICFWLADAGFFSEAKSIALETRNPSRLRDVARHQTEQQGVRPTLAWVERIEDLGLRACALNGLAGTLAKPEELLPDTRLNVRPVIAARVEPFGLTPY